MSDLSRVSDLLEQRVSRRHLLGIGAAAVTVAAAACRQEAARPAASPIATVNTPMLDWSAPGPTAEMVPTLTYKPSGDPTDWLRKYLKDWETIGLKFNVQSLTSAEWLAQIFERTYGDIELHGSPLRPERFDPTEWLVSRAYGPEGEVGKRNYGNYKSREYDKWVELQMTESDPKKRLESVLKAQEVLQRDYYTDTLWFDDVVDAYNKDVWEGVVPVVGNGVADNLLPWTLLNIKSKTGKKRLVVAAGATQETTNIIAATGSWRNWGRLIYDTFLKLDKDLNLIGWAAESWKQLDDVTWEIKLRQGMKWHDGKPVTIEDAKWTFDLLMQYKPGIMSLVWEPIAKVEISDPATLRFTLTQPYAQFTTISLMIAFILPKHIWTKLMQDQNASDPTKVVINSPESAVGSGMFKWGHYRRDEEILLTVNKEHWYKPGPNIDEYLGVTAASTNYDVTLGKLQTGEVDMAVVSPGREEETKAMKHLAVTVTPNLGWELQLPFVERMPWRDIELRKAWHLCVDKKFTVEVARRGRGIIPPNDSFLSPKGPWGNPNLKGHRYDVELAKQTLIKAGYTMKDGRLYYPPKDDAAFRKRIEQVLAVEGDWWGPRSDEVGPPPGRI